MILETVLGGLAGAVTRGLPLAAEFFDKKDERKHEREMFDKQIAADRLRGEQVYDQTRLEGDISYAVENIRALSEANKSQAEMAKAAGGWAASLSAAVRPITTFQLVALYMLAKLASFVLLVTHATTPADVMQGIVLLYTEADQALLAGVLAFWYMDRTITKSRG